MKLIIKILLICLPLPFILSHYTFLKDYNGSFYILKHSIIILLFLVSSLYYMVYIRKINKKHILPLSFFFLFFSYLIVNFLIRSNFNTMYISYILSFLILILLSLFLTRIDIGNTLLKLLYYSIAIIIFSAIAFSLLNEVELYAEWTDVSNGGTKRRWTFGFDHPGYFASFFYVLGILSILLIKGKVLVKAHYVILFLSLVLIFLSHTRNSFMALVLFILFSYSNKSFRFTKYLSILVFITFVVLISNDFNTINALSTGRFLNWATQLLYNYDQFSWFFGTGIGNAIRIDFHSNSGDVAAYEVMYHADNFFFDIFLQFGSIGLVLLIGFLLAILWIASKQQDTIVKRNIIAALFSMSFYSFFDSSLLSTGNLVSIVMWLIVFQQLNLKYIQQEIKC